MTAAPLVTDPVAHANIRKTLELILADVASWNQENWALRVPLVTDTSTTGGAQTCRTAFCVAGHYAVNVAGLEPIWHQSPLFGSDVADDGAQWRAEGASSVRLGDAEDADYEPMSDVAARAFGLDSSTAIELFRESNSLQRVLDVAYRATGGAVDLYAAYEELVARDADFAERELWAEDDARELDHGYACSEDAYRAYGQVTEHYRVEDYRVDE